MKMRRGLRLLVAIGTVAAFVLPQSAAQSQVPQSNMTIRFDGAADVAPGIFLPGLDGTSNKSWTWNFRASGCDANGTSGGDVVSGTGNCFLDSGGALLPDLLDKPACGNSAGSSSKPAVFRDPAGRQWTGEVHWDGVAKGDPSYSLGSQLYLWGTLTSGSETARITLMLNASGGSNCAPQLSPGGATSFTINGVGALTTLQGV